MLKTIENVKNKTNWENIDLLWNEIISHKIFKRFLKNNEKK